MMGGMMDGMMGNGMGFGMFFGWIFWLLILALVVSAILWLVRRSGATGDSTTNRTQSPQEILQRRLAQGEITSDQFETLKRQLQEG